MEARTHLLLVLVLLLFICHVTLSTRITVSPPNRHMGRIHSKWGRRPPVLGVDGETRSALLYR